MKKLMFIVLLVIAVGCSKKMDASKFAGTWSGNYSSRIINIPNSFDTGILHITIDANNNATGYLQSLTGGWTTILKGKTDPTSGTISISKSGENNGISVFLEGLTGNLSVDTGSGTLVFPWATTSGWEVIKN